MQKTYLLIQKTGIDNARRKRNKNKLQDVVEPFTSHRTRAVFVPINFKICPRVLLGISRPSTPGICNGTRVSTIWDAASTRESLVISNKDEMPTDLSRKVYLFTWTQYTCKDYIIVE